MIERENHLIIPILSAANFVIGMGAFIVIGLLDPISRDLNITASQAGWVMTSYAIAYAIFSPLVVSLTGSMGRRRVLTIGLCILAIANILSATAPNAITLNVARILAALGSGMFTPVAAAVAAGLSAPESRGRALATVFFGLTLAQVLGVPAGSYLAYTFGWRSAFFVVALLALPFAILTWICIPAKLKFQTVNLSDLRQTLANGPQMLAILFTASFLAAIYVVYTYLSPLLTGVMGYERNGVTFVLLIFGFGAVFGNIMGGYLADRLGPFRSLLCLAIAQAALLPFFSILPIFDIAFFVLVFIWSACGWSFMASQQVRLLEMAPESAGVVLALNAAAIYVGAAVGAAIGGAVLTLTGLNMLGITGGLLALVTIGHLIWTSKTNAVH
ncbi:MAG: MFS transporter [Litoreibacter sp.]